MGLYMESTKIPVESTVADIQRVLSRYRCQAIATKFTDAGEVESVMFQIAVEGRSVPFRLPARWEPVFEWLNGQRSPRTQAKLADQDREQAKRVAWRQILRWIEAQLALVQTNMVRMEEVFLPYVNLSDGKTLYERIAGHGFLALEDQARRRSDEHRA